MSVLQLTSVTAVQHVIIQMDLTLAFATVDIQGMEEPAKVN